MISLLISRLANLGITKAGGLTALGLILIGLGSAAESRGDLRTDALAALRKAGAFYHQNIAVHGGYIYYTDANNYTNRFAEGIPNMDQIFVQPPGTPAVGLAYLKAYRATGEAQFLNAAKDAADAMVYGQLVSGGWAQKIDFNPVGSWVGLYRNGLGSGNNHTSLDDGQTQAGITFMVSMDQALGFNDPVIHEATEYAVAALLGAQFPNGAFPQGWVEPVFPHPVMPASYPPLVTGHTWPHEGTWPDEEYWRYYTLNDGMAGDVSDSLLTLHEISGDGRFLNALRRLGDFLILAQMPEPQPAWCQQYNFAMHPVWARRFEPPAITGLESEDVIKTLMKIYRATGDAKYLAPLPRAIEYLKGNKLSDGRMARFYQLETNKPLYMYRQLVSTVWIYYLTYSDKNLPTHYGFKQPTEIDALEAEFLALQLGNPPPVPPPSVAELEQQVQQILAALDSQGRWVSTYAGEGLVGQPKFATGFRFIDSAVFNRHMETLSAYLIATAPVATPGRLVNLSIRSVAGTDADSLIVGFVTTGGTGGNASLMVRAAGPALIDFGVTDPLADPNLAVYDGHQAMMAANDNWGGLAALMAAAVRTGAFGFTDPASLDAALLVDLAPAPATAVVAGADGGTGIALAEVYDANTVGDTARPELINVSARARVETGAGIMIAGFVIGGDTPKTVLLRAVGPTLADYGVTGVLADPQLTLFDDAQVQLQTNNDWAATLAPTFTQVGAFSLPAGSKDAALQVTLAPGAYTVQVSGTADTTGVALVEIYAVP